MFFDSLNGRHWGAARSLSKSYIFDIVGGDAHIAPAVTLSENGKVRRNRNKLQRADVGIGPYEWIYRKLRAAPQCRPFL